MHRPDKTRLKFIKGSMIEGWATITVGSPYQMRWLLKFAADGKSASNRTPRSSLSSFVNKCLGLSVIAAATASLLYRVCNDDAVMTMVMLRLLEIPESHHADILL